MTTLDCRASWDGVLVGGFTIGNSLIAGTDGFTSAYDAVFGGTYDNLSTMVEEATWQRGRNDLGAKTMAGQASVRIVDELGIYNPANPASPLVGKLVPNRPFYIRAPDSVGTVRGCFRGYLLDEPAHDASVNPATTTFTLVDFFAVLNGAFPVIAPTGPTTTGAAIGLILDAVGLTDSQFRSLAVGDTIANFSADGSVSALALIQALLDAEQGQFFVNGGGVAVYLDRYDRYRRASVATINGTVSKVATGSPVGNIINRQTVTGATGGPQTSLDGASTGMYGFRDGSPISTAYLADAAAALASAQRIVSRRSTPRTLLTELELLSPVTGNLDQILLREFGDRISIPSGGAGKTGIAGDFFLEQLAVTASRGGVLDCSWILSARTVADSGFIIGSSTVAGTDLLVP